MKYIISRYNQSIDWLKDYSDDYVIYDRSEIPLEGTIVVPNIGTDIYDKFTYIIDNYDNLPDIAVYTKANLFKYITKEEYDALPKDRFTPILSQAHRTYDDYKGTVCYYKDELYYERNDLWYLITLKHFPIELQELLGIDNKEFVGFAPGSNYILPKENILKHPKEFYQKLRSFLDYDIYPSEAHIIERGLYYLWK